MNDSSPPGWYQDPTGQGDARYWNGSSWTQAVDRGGVTANVPIDPNQAVIPPTPGTQVSIPAPPVLSSANGPRTSGRAPVVAIVGVLIAVLIAVVVIVVVTDDSSESPTPGTDAPPATAAPATDPPADGG